MTIEDRRRGNNVARLTFIPKALSELPVTGRPAAGAAFQYDLIYSVMSSKVHHAHNFILRPVN